MEAKIKQVLAVEKKAEKIISDANIKAAGILEDARTESMMLRSDFEKDIQKIRVKKLMVAETEIKSQKKKIAKEGEAENKKISQSAQENIGKAADFVIGLLKKVD